MNLAGILVAGGRGVRAGGAIPKQYRQIHGLPVLAWSLRALFDAGVSPIVIVAAAEDETRLKALIAPWPGVLIAPAGPSRTASVRSGLRALSARTPDYGVLIHDAARPGLSPAIIERLREALAAGAEAVAPALPAPDSLRRQGADGANLGIVDRAGIVRIQTPQAFPLAKIQNAYADLAHDADISDDLSVAEAAGMNVSTIPGDPLLMKLTYEEDFAMFERLASPAAADRFTATGTGFDAHRFGEGDHVALCGVRIPHEQGLAGHSDADVAWHALVDAILGALGDGDIGAHFSPSDPQWKGASSETFLRFAAQRVRERGARLLHVDATVICERPKVGPHREEMRARTAEVLGLDIARVSIKATTTEKMGFTGRGEGIAAMATATVDRPAV